MERLLELAEIRVRARRFGIKSISLRPPDVVFLIEDPSKAEAVFTETPGSVRMPDPRTVHLRLPRNYLEPSTLVPVLRKLFMEAKPRVEATA